MRNMLKNAMAMLMLMVAALLAGVMAVPSQDAQAAKTMTVTYKGKLSNSQKEKIQSAGKKGTKIKVVVKKGVKKIKDDAFDQLPISDVKIPNSVTSIGAGAFSGCNKLKNVKIPNSVKSIGWGAFTDCKKLESIKIPNSVKEIGNDAFKFCTNLKSVKLSNGVKEIKDSTFLGCKKLKILEIPEGVTKIGFSAFQDCKNLKSVKIPDSMESIASLDFPAFEGCSKLKSITWKGNTYSSLKDFEKAREGEPAN